MIEISVPEISAKPFFEQERFEQENRAVKEFWERILDGLDYYSVKWEDKFQGKIVGFHILSKSMENGYDYRISYWDRNSQPFSHVNYKKHDMLDDNFDSILRDLPWSQPNSPVILTIEEIHLLEAEDESEDEQSLAI